METITEQSTPITHTNLTVIIADDHPLFRTALKQTLNESLDHPHFLEACDISSLQQLTEQHPMADLILLDLHMPGAHGFSGLIYLRAHHPEIPVIMVSANESPDIINRAINHGAATFLPKCSSQHEIAETVEQIIAGNTWLPPFFDPNKQSMNQQECNTAHAISTLTPQQFRVTNMIAKGLLNKQIAYELNITEATVKAHITEIFRKLGVHSRTQAVLAISQLDVQAHTT